MSPDKHSGGAPTSPTRRRDAWRTLDELAGDPAFQARLYNEFPSEVEAITDPATRRTFMKLMGASVALAGLAGCTRQPAEKIVPYVRQPEHLIPGKPLYFATAMSIGAAVTGLLVESHEGRPTKVEGNPLHPDSLGAADVFAQAAILGLYDPDRARTILNLGEIRPWPAFVAAMKAALAAQASLQGAGIRLLTETVTSPTLAAQIRDLLRRFPSAKWHQWDPAGRNNGRLGARLTFEQDVDALYRIDQADVILALDADFLGSGPGALRHARQFASRRKPEPAGRMNRLYAIESMPSLTGAKADHRFAARPSEVLPVARAIAAAIGGAVFGADVASPDGWGDSVFAIAKDLQEHRGRSLVVAGETQPPELHALANLMNQALGNIGTTVDFIPSIDPFPGDHLASLRELTADMDAGHVDLLVILGGNPVYTAPADVPFADALSRVLTRVHLSLYDDETSELCHWHIPEAHFLEAWSDALGSDGTASVVQPLIAPLYGGRSAHELLATFSDTPERSGYESVRDYWMRASGVAAPLEFERRWRSWLHDGLIPNTARAPRTVASDVEGVARRISASAGTQRAAPGYEISFRLDPTVLDGRFASNSWLQELPKPITKITWDNAVIVSPATAETLRATIGPAMQGGEHGQVVSDLVELTFQNRSVRGALFAVPGHPDRCATVHLGYGRRRSGDVGRGAGFNAYAIRTAGSLWSGRGLEIQLTGEQYSLACTQHHHLMENRNLVRVATRDEYLRDPHSVHGDSGHGEENNPRKTITLYPDYTYEGYKWGMAIDVNACIGCNACVVGCQAENNIPVIGKDQVLRGREMHWIRVDTYYTGPKEQPDTYFQPVTCMHCENAPCEPVCPVAATVHSHEGLNEMVYNRCVGTRYCANNCPYKVRRFNYLLYQDWNTPSLKLARNPDVSVRSRGVMEKCTYCVQRINEAKIDAEKSGRRIADGDIKTACQQTCPAEAIVFGDLNDPTSRVARLQAEVRNYGLLTELNTRPRTTYLAVVRNPNPELGG
jgi:molybdopterin-containing oxidoreductase family iron-sulfur binding subunit